MGAKELDVSFKDSEITLPPFETVDKNDAMVGGTVAERESERAAAMDNECDGGR